MKALLRVTALILAITALSSCRAVIYRAIDRAGYQVPDNRPPLQQP